MCFEIFHILDPIASGKEVIAVLDMISDMSLMETFGKIRETVGMYKTGYAAFFKIIACRSTGEILGFRVSPGIKTAGRDIHIARCNRRKEKMLVKRHIFMVSGIFLQVLAEPERKGSCDIRDLFAALAAHKCVAAATGVVGKDKFET